MYDGITNFILISPENQLEDLFVIYESAMHVKIKQVSRWDSGSFALVSDCAFLK